MARTARALSANLIEAHALARIRGPQLLTTLVRLIRTHYPLPVRHQIGCVMAARARERSDRDITGWGHG
jgi:hypothetical protein